MLKFLTILRSGSAWLMLSLLALGLCFWGNHGLTPESALRNHFSAISQPMVLDSGYAMIDSNTWLTITWDKPLTQAWQDAVMTGTVRIRTSLPDQLLSEKALYDRQTYLALFKAKALHDVELTQPITLRWEGFKWNVASPLTAKEFVEARLSAFHTRGFASGVTFVRDNGLYLDATAYSTFRQMHAFSQGVLGVFLMVTLVVVGFMVGIAQQTPMPFLVGVAGATCLKVSPLLWPLLFAQDIPVRFIGL